MSPFPLWQDLFRDMACITMHLQSNDKGGHGLPPDRRERICLEPAGIHCRPEGAGNAFSERAEFRPVLAPGLVFSQKNTGKKGPSMGAGISLALELLQWLLRRGYFDSLDALLYWAGIAVGYGQAKLIGRAFFNRKQKPGYTAQRQSKTAIGVLASARTPICCAYDGF